MAFKSRAAAFQPFLPAAPPPESRRRCGTFSLKPLPIPSPPAGGSQPRRRPGRQSDRALAVPGRSLFMGQTVFLQQENNSPDNLWL